MQKKEITNLKGIYRVEGDFMKNEILKTELNAKANLIRVLRIGNIDYISLTDLARYKNQMNPGDVIIKWMSNKDSFDFYSLWEEIFNPNFKLGNPASLKIILLFVPLL